MTVQVGIDSMEPPDLGDIQASAFASPTQFVLRNLTERTVIIASRPH